MHIKLEDNEFRALQTLKEHKNRRKSEPDFIGDGKLYGEAEYAATRLLSVGFVGRVQINSDTRFRITEAGEWALWNESNRRKRIEETTVDLIKRRVSEAIAANHHRDWQSGDHDMAVQFGTWGLLFCDTLIKEINQLERIKNLAIDVADWSIGAIREEMEQLNLEEPGDRLFQPAVDTWHDAHEILGQQAPDISEFIYDASAE